jgi:arylsulfatase A-like enzyme
MSACRRVLSPLVVCRLLSTIWLLPTIAAQAPDNLLLVIADDVGVDNIGCYGLGSAPPPTPTIDGLAARGVRFTDATACPTCSPSRASVLTGRHGFRTGIGRALPQTSPGLSPNEVLLPEILRPAGIRTALIGKWHLGNDLGPLTPTAEGFDVFTGALNAAVPSYYAWPKVENGSTSTSTVYATTDCVNEALQFVQTTTQPWFLLLSFNAAHTPYEAPPASLHSQSLGGLNPNTTPLPFYLAMVEAMDHELGRLLATLPAATVQRTNIVFLGDNGTAVGGVQPPFDPNRSKGTLYQGGVRVPLIVAGPAVSGPPRSEAGRVHAVDLFATLAALQGVDARAAVPANRALDGVSFAPQLQVAGQPSPREFVYTQEFGGTTAMASSGDGELIRDEHFTLLRMVQPSGAIAEELYDLAADPWQNTNLLQQPLSSAVAARYTALRRALAQLRGYPWSAPFGSGCTSNALQPTLAVVNGSAPVLGGTFTLRVQGLLPTVPATVLAIGLDASTWNGQPLPVSLDGIGMTGCELLLAPALTDAAVTTALGATFAIALPANASLAGRQLFTQAFPLAPAANPAGILATNGIEAVLGS